MIVKIVVKCPAHARMHNVTVLYKYTAICIPNDHVKLHKKYLTTLCRNETLNKSTISFQLWDL